MIMDTDVANVYKISITVVLHNILGLNHSITT